MNRYLFALAALVAVTGCAAPLPPGYHYEPGSFTPTKNEDDGLIWCKPYVDHRVQSSECDVAIARVQNSPAAKKQQKNMDLCLMEGSAYRQAASYRDDGMSPQNALSYMKAYGQYGIQDDFLKRAINSVYFDGRFAGAGGKALSDQMADMCLYPNGRFKPLN